LPDLFDEKEFEDLLEGNPEEQESTSEEANGEE
jgi:hypothetical protein